MNRPLSISAVRMPAEGLILIVWRNDPGYNVTLMAQVSRDEGLTWSLAAPMHGVIDDGAYEQIVDAPFGVEPKLQMMDSGVVVLSTGRPRMYLWALAPGADPLTAVWQPIDQGKIHNAAVALGGSPSSTPAGVMAFAPEYWRLWRGATDPSLRSMGCCTDAYTGLVALPGTDTLVMTYDLLAFNCPKGVFSPNNVCDFIVSLQMEVTVNGTTIKTDDHQLGTTESKRQTNAIGGSIVQVGVARGSVRLSHTTPPSKPAQRAGVIDLAAQLGECEHAQVWIRAEAPGTELRSIRPSVKSPLSLLALHEGGGSIDGSHVQFAQVGYVNCSSTTAYSPSGGGWTADVLLPVSAQSPVPRVPAGTTQPLWVTVCVPPTATPGNYSATIEVAGSAHPSTTWSVSVPLKLEVWPIVLPPVNASGTFNTEFSFEDPCLTTGPARATRCIRLGPRAPRLSDRGSTSSAATAYRRTAPRSCTTAHAPRSSTECSRTVEPSTFRCGISAGTRMSRGGVGSAHSRVNPGSPGRWPSWSRWSRL